jgi:hypothetical protein
VFGGVATVLTRRAVGVLQELHSRVLTALSSEGSSRVFEGLK